MKNLFLALAFILTSSFVFANDNSVISLEYKNLDFYNYKNNTPVYLASDPEHITLLKYQLYQLCIAYEEHYVSNESGGTTASGTFVFIGVAVSDEHCENMIEAAKVELLNSY